MTTPTRIIVDLATGQTTEVELSGAELEAYNASLAQQAAEAAQQAAAQQAAAQQAAEAASAKQAPVETPVGQ
jgi:septal ring factor EnvC (AmiA/AmiB activator)